MKRIVGGFAAFTMLCGLALPASAQTPEAIDGERAVVPVVDDGTIVLDGDLGDWATLPANITNGGPMPSADPANSGQMRWQIASTDTTLYFAATITDDLIIAGRNGDNYWNEDSIELYLNFGDLTATSYGDPGLGQITISAVDRGNADPTALTLSGNDAPNFDVTGFVFATTAGWGLEVAIDLTGKTTVANGTEFGLQVQANGSSGEDRDLKLGWSIADVDDTSFQDPSVFGRGVFVGGAASDVVDQPPPEEASADAASAESEVETIIADNDTQVVETTDTEPEPGRTLLFAAVLSAASILIGGAWFERRRKKSEEKLAAPDADKSTDDSPDDDEDFDELVASILDD